PAVRLGRLAGARAGPCPGAAGRRPARVRGFPGVTRPGGRRVLAADVVVAVVVTKDRPDTLQLSLEAICAQSRPVDHVIVVDNGADPKVAELVEALDLPTTYLPSRRNLGG